MIAKRVVIYPIRSRFACLPQKQIIRSLALL
jgi:hypothetical protein